MGQASAVGARLMYDVAALAAADLDLKYAMHQAAAFKFLSLESYREEDPVLWRRLVRALCETAEFTVAGRRGRVVPLDDVGVELTDEELLAYQQHVAELLKILEQYKTEMAEELAG